MQGNFPASAVVVSQRPGLAVELWEQLRGLGVSVEVAGVSAGRSLEEQLPAGDLVVFDADTPGVDPDALSAFKRRRAGVFAAAVVGWWDAREAELSPVADFLLNAPLREWQVRELVAHFRSRRPREASFAGTGATAGSGSRTGA